MPGILVGHDTNLEAATGCTVVVCETPTRGGVDVRGGAPGTRETDLLDPRCMVEVVNAVLLTGGSAFGLNAAAGVVRSWRNVELALTSAWRVCPSCQRRCSSILALAAPISVPTRSGARERHWSPLVVPSRREPSARGQAPTLGKMGGPALAMKGGIGSASAIMPDGHVVGALVAVNASGDVYDHESGVLVAGARHPMAAGSHWVDRSSVVRLRFLAQTRRLPSSPPMRN